MTDDIVLLHHKLDLILRLLEQMHPQLLETLKVLPSMGSGTTNSKCPVCKEGVKISIYPSSGEIRRECRCNKDLGVRSLGPLPTIPHNWSKREPNDD
jgi:hypothetical protein